MKTIRTIIVTMLIANMLALIGLGVWLKQSGRLNRERVDRVRAVFTKTIEQEEAEKAQATAKAEEQAKAQAAAIKLASAPLTAAEQISKQNDQEEAKLQSALRREREIEDLRSSLLRQKQALDDREKQLIAERASFEAEKKRYAEIEGAQQFKAALTTLEGQKPKDAKSVLRSMLDGQQVEQVVAYLSRMDEGKRTKIIAEFVKDEPTTAADLLERLRTRGSGLAGSAPGAGAGGERR